MSFINKQNKNGDIGETRTEGILKEYFLTSKRNLDIDGEDLIIEIPFDNRKIFREFQAKGVVQAKYFEKKNEVKIARDYVEDEDGIRTNFFAFIHTDDEKGQRHHYFFTAEEIVKEFRPRKSKKEYYVFRLTKSKTFENHKDLFEDEIFDRIEESILKTEEFRRQKLVRQVEDKFQKKTIRNFEKRNDELFQEIKDRHIIDKVYRCINVFKDFRRIISWRLIDKISFPETHRTSTTYHNFALKTNNNEVLSLFRNLEIDETVKIREIKDYGTVKNYHKKVQKIISTLNQNLIIKVDDLQEHEILNIHQKNNQHCNCSNCLFGRLDFNQANRESIKPNDLEETELWDLMRKSYVLIQLGKYDAAKKLLLKTYDNAQYSKQSILLFFAKYNLRILAWKVWEDEYPDLENELNSLNISGEKKDILRSLADNSLTKDYAVSIDEIYIKIKDYKERAVVNNTDTLVTNLYCKYSEYANFHQGNYLTIDTTSDFKKIAEKVIESFIVSYSMRSNFGKHIEHFNDFIVRTIIHYCESSSLLKWFQRNGISEVKYLSDNQFFKTCIVNFLSEENIQFFSTEIVYIDNRTKNPDLRRKVENIFDNICILIAYLSIDLKINFLHRVTKFIEIIDLSVHNISLLAHPLLKKSRLFASSDIINLIKILSNKDLTEGYIITNCLYALNEKNYLFDTKEKNLVGELINISVEKCSYGQLNVLPSIISTKDKVKLQRKITTKLDNEFDPELYAQALFNNLLDNPKKYLNNYFKIFEKLNHSGSYLLFGFKSPYTGIDYRIAEKLNELVNIYYKIDDSSLSDHPIIIKIKELDPYYDFILKLNEEGIDENFKIDWLLENQSETVLEKISMQNSLRRKLESSLQKDFSPDLSKLYFKCFTDLS